MANEKKDGTWVTIGGARILLGSPAHTKLLKSIQQRRQAMKDTARGMEEAESYVGAACLILHEAGCTEVTPPGFEHVVKSLKRKKGVENPWAVAWSMKNKGAEPGAKKKEAFAFASDLLEQAARLVEAVEDAEAGTSAGAKAGWERRKRGGDPKPAATPEEIGEQRREFAKRSKAARFSRPSRQKMDVGGTISARTERQRRQKALDQMFAKKYSTIGMGNRNPDAAGWSGGTPPAPRASEAAYEILEDVDALLEALTDEAGTSAGAKAGWEKRKGGGGAPHGPGGGPDPGQRYNPQKPNPKRAAQMLKQLKGRPIAPYHGAKDQRPFKDLGLPSDPKFWVGTNLGPKEKIDPEWGTLPGGQVRRHRSAEAAQPVRATLVIREAVGMSSLPQLGRSGTRVPGRPGSGLVRKDDGSVERVPVQKGSFHDDLRRKTSLRRVMHANKPLHKVGAA